MTVYLLGDEPVFPPAEEADEDGLIAIGGDLSVPRLIQAYASGIFPWFMQDQDIFWFSPDPRMVLYPQSLKVSKSLRRIIRSERFEIRTDTVFGEVIDACSAQLRPGQEGTWISRSFTAAYQELHRAGYAHSVETFRHGRLVGGLYGVSLGSAFFGESMFFHEKDASKVALAGLASLCRNVGLRFIDCQVENPHLISLGAEPMPRIKYLTLLEEVLENPTRRGKWPSESDVIS
jgi:leucyl/phenylalanyl-tRNA--protein transferase